MNITKRKIKSKNIAILMVIIFIFLLNLKKDSSIDRVTIKGITSDDYLVVRVYFYDRYGGLIGDSWQLQAAAGLPGSEQQKKYYIGIGLIVKNIGNTYLRDIQVVPEGTSGNLFRKYALDPGNFSNISALAPGAESGEQIINPLPIERFISEEGGFKIHQLTIMLSGIYNPLDPRLPKQTINLAAQINISIQPDICTDSTPERQCSSNTPGKYCIASVASDPASPRLIDCANPTGCTDPNNETNAGCDCQTDYVDNWHGVCIPLETLYGSFYMTGEGSDSSVNGNYLQAQIFSINNDFTLNKVGLILKKKYDSLPIGSLYIKIREYTASGGLTGSDLTTGHISGNEIPTGTFTWVNISMLPADLDPAKQYAIILSSPDSILENPIYTKYDPISSHYPEGRRFTSTNGGGSWSPTNEDIPFELYGPFSGMPPVFQIGYNNGTGSGVLLYDGQMYAQEFRTIDSLTLQTIKLGVASYYSTGSISTVYLGLKNNLAGSDIISASFNGQNMPTTFNVQSIHVDDYQLAAETIYYLVMRNSPGETVKVYYNPSGTYSDGSLYRSRDNGVSWTLYNGDAHFELWGQ